MTTPRKRATPAVKKVDARQAEADGFIDIEHCGITLRIPVGDAVPLGAYIAFKDGDEFGGTELLLGPEQWTAFLATKPTIGDFNAIGDKITGLLGNSSASFT